MNYINLLEDKFKELAQRMGWINDRGLRELMFAVYTAGAKDMAEIISKDEHNEI